jgi:hypothetical protein
MGELNVPDDRLDIHNMSNILYLCGGSVGVRFTSAELTQLAKVSHAKLMMMHR